ncbi:MAG: hypothetical protein ACETVR_04330 [Candidatus Bathyarchaeia archaeon]
MARGKPFLEIVTFSLNEDYRFPLLEVFVFLYTMATFVLSGFRASATMTGVIVAFNLVSSLTGLPMFIFVILILKNIAYGLGSDLEKGMIQTLFSYPLKRRLILTAKLLSALGIALLLFLGIQVFALFILAPDVVFPYLNTVFLTYAAALGYPLLVAGLVLLLTLLLKRGGLALIMGIALFFGLSILSPIVWIYAYSAGSDLFLKVYALVNPSMVLDLHYSRGVQIWAPSFSEALLYIGGCYGLVASVFIVGYVYFERRLEI